MLAACTTAFTACNNEESLPDTGNQLKLSFGINAPQSRAIFTDTKLPDSSPVGVTLDGYADYANIVYTGTTASGKQTWTPDKQVRLSDTQGTLYAYYPYSSTTSINAIEVDMTADDQTDWLYATPVTGICEDKAEATVTMNHALANINVTVNKGTYLGEGNISNITLQSDGIALGGTFNAAQATPGYTAFENEGEPLSRNVTTTTGTATDIMVIPTGTEAAVTFLLTIDGILFTAKSADVTLEMGNSYQYTLNLSDISTYMTIGSFGVTPWGSKTGGNLNLVEKKPIEGTIDLKTAGNGVYAVAQNGKGVAIADADESCVGVALIRTNAPTPQRIMIAKNDATNDGSNYDFYYDYDKGDLSLTNYNTVEGVSSGGYLNKISGQGGSGPQLNTDFTTWTDGALSDFNGKNNTIVIASSSDNSLDMCKVLETFNGGTSSQNNEGFNDWYVPACGQLALMYLAKTEINAALTKIGGTVLGTYTRYWSSSEYDSYNGWYIYIYSSKLSAYDAGLPGKNAQRHVRFVRDIN